MSASGELLQLVQLQQKDRYLIQTVDAALADAALRSGEHLVCRPGCTQCCHGAFAITALDAMRLRSGMSALHIANPELGGAIEARARHYLLEFGPEFPGNKSTGILGQTPSDLEAFDDFANEAACPALNPSNGFCDLYEARPIACRAFGPPVRMGIMEGPEEESGFAVCDLCFNDATPDEVESCEMILPREQEQRLILDAEQLDSVFSGETIVAYCLLPQSITPAAPIAS